MTEDWKQINISPDITMYKNVQYQQYAYQQQCACVEYHR